MLRVSLICASAGIMAVAGCRSADGEGVEAVATTTHVADLVRHVAGAETEVHGILSAGTDPHDYEPRPSDAAALSEASVIFTSGGEVDAWVDELIESSGTDAEVVELLESAVVRRDLEGEVDPHWWQDPRNAIAAVRTIRDELARAYPAEDGEYAGNAAAFVQDIEKMDKAVASCMAGLPGGARRIVTAHDSLGYLADRYDIEVVGAAIPALSTQAQASAGETSDLIRLIESERVQAVFPEAGLTHDLEDAIAGEANVAVGDALYADALGEEGTAGETYVGAFTANAAALVEAMSAGSVSCDTPEAR